MTPDPIDLLKLTATIVAAHLSNNRVALGAVPAFIKEVRKALAVSVDAAPEQGIAQKAEAESIPERPSEQRPAVPADESVAEDFLICLEDGAKVKTLKRYLRRFNLTPEQYRVKWGLAADYPMTAPAYSKLRRRWAKKIGLGTKSKSGGARKRRSSRQA